MKNIPLKEALQEWSDVPSAQMTLAINIGLMTVGTNYQVDAKHVFWSNHPVGNMLENVLKQLVQLNILEYRETPDDNEYRWNPAYKGGWEK